MNFVCIVFELGDKMLTLPSMENLIVQCNHILASCLLRADNENCDQTWRTSRMI